MPRTGFNVVFKNVVEPTPNAVAADHDPTHDYTDESFVLTPTFITDTGNTPPRKTVVGQPTWFRYKSPRLAINAPDVFDAAEFLLVEAVSQEPEPDNVLPATGQPTETGKLYLIDVPVGTQALITGGEVVTDGDPLIIQIPGGVSVDVSTPAALAAAIDAGDVVPSGAPTPDDNLGQDAIATPAEADAGNTGKLMDAEQTKRLIDNITPGNWNGSYVNADLLPAVTVDDNDQQAYVGFALVGTGTTESPEKPAGFYKVVAGAWVLDQEVITADYTDRFVSILATLGWRREGGSVNENATNFQFSIEAASYHRITNTGVAEDSPTWPLQNPAQFRYWDSNGLVTLGAAGDDFSALQDTFNQDVGWDNAGTLEQLNNDGYKYGLFQDPATGDILIGIATSFQPTGNAAMQRHDAMTFARPPGYSYLGFFIVDDGGTSFRYFVPDDGIGASGTGTTTGAGSIYRATKAEAEALTAADGLVDSMVVHYGLGATYERWAVITAGSSFGDVSTVKEKLYPLDLEIVRYTADGPIQDKDHRAIFETGADNMTLAVSTQDRLIQIISEGPATVITADGTEQFTGPGGTTTDSTLNVNETFQWATLLGRGAAAGWSQYVGQVATAQSVGSMVDFSESPGPGDAGSFSLALTNSGANLRYILTLTCSNGTNFSPPLDVDDGTNRWWYDFDHTTGVVNVRRFGAFAGGSVRGVALYS